jgi:thioesterase domain-containing protein/acyl carrier protein
VKDRLPEYMVPQAVMPLPRLPLNSNGKIDRRALPEPEHTQAELEIIAPRDQTEAALLRIWRRVLARETISVTDNFFELGGHSLMAIQLMAEIKKETGNEIPLSALFRAPSIESMAQLLREGTQSDADPMIVQLQAAEGVPFFAVVGPGATAIGYAALARALGPRQSFYKLQSHRPLKPAAPIPPLEMRFLAREYIEAMRSVQPTGPYYFGGMCMGTHIAEQMVLELEEQGEEVGLFVILDTWVLQNSQIRWLWRVDYYRQRMRSMRRLELRMKLAVVLQSLTKKMRQVARPFSDRSEKVWSKVYWPGKEFKAPCFRAPVALFKRPRQPFFYVKDETMGWGPRAGGGVEIHGIDFPHRMLREPYVQELASRLRDCLSRATTIKNLRKERRWEPISAESRPVGS